MRGDRGRREVRAPERAARGEARVELLAVGGEADVAEALRHALDPVRAVGAPVFSSAPSAASVWSMP